MDASLIASAFLLGLAGSPHCAAMCAAPCAAAVGRGGWGSQIAFQLARVAGYAGGGAVAAASVSALAQWSAVSPALRPLWTLLNASALILGLWLLRHGRQPAWLGRLGRTPQVASRPDAGGWQAVQGPARSAAVGALWVAWPCGLLQSALLVASLSDGAAAGAAAMAAFGLASASGLVAGPWIWRRVQAWGRSMGDGDSGGAGSRRVADSIAFERWATRAAGLLLVGASAWALFHQVAPQIAAFCSTL